MTFEADIANIKISVNVGKNEERIKELFRCSPRWGNFIVLRRRYVFTIFSNGHVNVTGIPNLKGIEDCLKVLQKLLKSTNKDNFSWKIDNICARGSTGLPCILLRPFYNVLIHHQKHCFLASFLIRIRFEPEKFPALQLKTRLGSILIFGSGKYILVGYRQALDAFFLLTLLKHVLGVQDGERCPIQTEKFLPA